MTLQFTDYRNDPTAWASKLNISTEAVEIYLASEVIDLHTDSFLWPKLAGYKMLSHHRSWPWGNLFGRQVDFPRCLEAQMAGMVWDIPTNPLRRTEKRFGILKANISLILSQLKTASDHFQHVVSYQDYLTARQAGKVASWISIQGGQAIDCNLSYLERIPEVHRITLVHFTRSRIGVSNFDRLRANQGLSHFGFDFVQKMADQHIMVDLSHINRAGFFDALSALPKDIPAVVTHTGVKAKCNIWRNIDDAQVKAIGERNGTIGMIYEKRFIGTNAAQQNMAQIVDHMDHIIKLIGDDHVSLGSDYDGMITLPNDFQDITYQPILVQKMLDKHWGIERIQKILGRNFLRVVKEIRPL